MSKEQKSLISSKNLPILAADVVVGIEESARDPLLTADILATV